MTEADILPRLSDLMADARHIQQVWRNMEMVDQAPTTKNTGETPMTDAHRAVLAAITHGPLSMVQIQRAANLSKSTVANAVTALKVRAYVSDAYVMDGCIKTRVVSITDDGKEAAQDSTCQG